TRRYGAKPRHGGRPGRPESGRRLAHPGVWQEPQAKHFPNAFRRVVLLRVDEEAGLFELQLRRYLFQSFVELLELLGGRRGRRRENLDEDGEAKIETHSRRLNLRHVLRQVLDFSHRELLLLQSDNRAVPATVLEEVEARP